MSFINDSSTTFTGLLCPHVIHFLPRVIQFCLPCQSIFFLEVHLQYSGAELQTYISGITRTKAWLASIYSEIGISFRYIL